MLSHPHRTLVRALTVSVLIHAALLPRMVRLLPTRSDVTEKSVAIRAVMLRDQSEDLSKPLSKPLSAPTVKPQSVPVRPLSPVVRNVPEPKAVVAESSPAVLAPPPARSVSHDVGLAVPSLSDNRVEKSEAPKSISVPAREGVRADDLHQYRMALATAARRFRHYPALARERGWEGTVEVALEVHALLPTPQVVLVRTSGRQLLDEHALDMMAQAVRVTILPEGLRGRDVRLLMPVKFSLDDEQP